MNSRWLNRIVLGLAAPGLAAGAWGTAGIVSGVADKKSKPDFPPLARPTSPPDDAIALKTINAFKQEIDSSKTTSEDLPSLAANEWAGSWPAVWKKITGLSPKHTPAVPEKDWIDAIRNGKQSALLLELQKSLDLLDEPATRDLEKLSGQIDTLLGTVPPGNLAAIYTLRREKLVNLTKELRQQIPASAAPVPKSDREFASAGIQFAWIEDGKFWISKSEIKREAVGTCANDLHANGIPNDWIIKQPDENQWLAAKKVAANLELADFDGGLGEILADGKIIGAATAFQKSKDKEIADHSLSPALRKDKTKILTREAQKGGGFGGLRGSAATPATPAQYDYENSFATRIVIAPPP